MPQQRSKSEIVADHKRFSLKNESRLVCKPLDSLQEIMLFLENPPPWRTLCREMTPHSNFLIRNIDVHRSSEFHSLERPENFCHYDPDSDDVKRHEAKTLPKTLVCHDMANGYHDDCIIDGTSNTDSYTFYNWAGIDIFCYFSHHLITIPPVGWINVGHAHGVKVIGTIITEWAEGVAFWDQVLTSEVQYQNVASALVAIAKTLKFDGYLLNVENKIALPAMLLEFVRYLHRLLHDELPHATLLWYDSVTVQGNLSWQNKLNDKNMAFFEACDGLFTNYSWSPEDVPASAELAAGRLTDLYIGIDVWGRNFFGGGQFNTQQAIKVVHAAGCSIALFAPAWTHEALSLDSEDHNHVAMGDNLDAGGIWRLRDRAFWGSIWPFLNTRVPCHIPFATSFCRGQGKKRWLYGEVLCPSPWFNLRHQQYQPNSAHGPHGYMLTSVENLAKVKDEVHYKDKKGIIRIRASFMQTRADLLAVNRESLPTTSVQDALHLEASSSASHSDPQPHGSKVDALKNLFKHKPVKISEQEEESEPATEARISEQPSVAEASVSLHLSRKQAQRYGLALVPDEQQCLELHHGDSFSGGACLMVHPSDRLCPEHRVTRLFHCDFPCEEELIFCVVTKTLREFPEQTLNVKMSMRNAADEDLTVVLTGRTLAQTSHLDMLSHGIMHVYPLNTAREDVLRELRTYLLLTQPGYYVPVDNQFGWTVRYFEINVPGSRITSVSLRTGAPSGPILLGHLAIWKKTKDKSWTIQLPVVKESLKGLTSALPQSVTSALPQSVTSALPQSVTSVLPQSVTSALPQSVTSFLPQSVTSALPQSVTSAQPQSVTRAQPQSVTRAQPQTVTRAQPQSVTRAQPQSVTSAQPQSVTRAQPQSVTRAQPQSVTSAQPQSLTSAQPQSLTSAQPQSVTSAQPQTVTSAQPQSLTSAQPQSVTRAQPQSVTSAQPQSVTSAQPQTVTSAQPQSVTRAQPQRVTRAQPQSVTRAQPQSVTRAHSYLDSCVAQ